MMSPERCAQRREPGQQCTGGVERSRRFDKP